MANTAPLQALAEELRTDPLGGRRLVPSFDPDSGGVGSRVLILMERPSRITVAAGDAAVCSEDNPGPTAAALRASREQARLPRAVCLRWNLIPWGLSERPGPGAVAEGATALAKLIALLPELRVIVTFGAVALDGVMTYLTTADDPVLVPVIGAPHPSPANGWHRTDQYDRAVRALQLARGIAVTGDNEEEPS